jgi:hypothetical protein
VAIRCSTPRTCLPREGRHRKADTHRSSRPDGNRGRLTPTVHLALTGKARHAAISRHPHSSGFPDTRIRPGGFQTPIFLWKTRSLWGRVAPGITPWGSHRSGRARQMHPVRRVVVAVPHTIGSFHGGMQTPRKCRLHDRDCKHPDSVGSMIEGIADTQTVPARCSGEPRGGTGSSTRAASARHLDVD